MYDKAIIFTKRANLLQWLYKQDNMPVNENTIRRYSKERDVRLVLWVRYDIGKTSCKISCPISPLPVKGIFEPASERAVCEFLQENGWSMVNSLPLYLAKR